MNLKLGDIHISAQNRTALVHAVRANDVDEYTQIACYIVSDLLDNGFKADALELIQDAKDMAATHAAVVKRMNGEHAPALAKVPRDIINELRERTCHLPADWIENDAPPHAFVIHPYIPKRAVSSLIGAGTSSKTLLVCEWAACIITGNDWRDHRTDEGDVVILTWEDEASDYHSKLYSLLHARPDLMPYADQIRKRLHIINMRGDHRYKLIAGDDYGKPHATPLPHNIVELIRQDFPDTVHVFIETVSRANGADETNEAFAAVVLAGEIIATDLDCGVTAVHHVSKAALSNGSVDATAGRGGSALADNCRATTVLLMVTSASDKTLWPTGFEEGDFGDREIVLIESARTSYARMADRLYLERIYPPHGAPYLRALGDSTSRKDEPKRDIDSEKVYGWLKDQAAAKEGMTERYITDQRAMYGLSERKSRAALARLVDGGSLTSQQAPQWGKTGKMATFYRLKSV